MFNRLTAPQPDSLMQIGKLYRADDRPDKIDLGVGTYRGETGEIEIMNSVKEAEGRLLATRTSKGYLGPGGDARFCALLTERLFPGIDPAVSARLASVQTPGGTGAYRLGLELAAHAKRGTTLLVGTPTWPNHIPVARRAGVETSTYAYFDPETGRPDFEAIQAAVLAARAGDMLLLHGSCHNPTGASLEGHHWAALAELLAATGVVPVIDLAYAGMARGLDEDVSGARFLLEVLPEAIVAISCSKSFGLYSERTGMLLVLAANAREAGTSRLVAEALARPLWSNPPDHGAAIVRTILEDGSLSQTWHGELEAMRMRLAGLRRDLAAARLPGADRIGEQEGLFAMLSFSTAEIETLRINHAIYIDGSGRINIAGLNGSNLGRFLASCRIVSGH